MEVEDARRVGDERALSESEPGCQWPIDLDAYLRADRGREATRSRSSFASVPSAQMLLEQEIESACIPI